jgi:hypothetical protein
MAETALQFLLEDEIVLLDQTLGIIGALGPDERGTVVLERQRREGTGRQEMLLRRPAMRTLVLDGGDDARLAVIELDDLDARRLAQPRTNAVAGDPAAAPRSSRRPPE